MVLPLRWALRVDAKGIARRRLISWDLWEWKDFASGRIQKKHPFMFVDPLRPWWRGNLNVGYLSPTNAKEVVKLVNLHYRLPPPPIIGEILTLRYRGMRAVVLKTSGLSLGKYALGKDQPEEQRWHSWQDVQRVHVTRADPVRRDFGRLEIVLPGEELLFMMVSGEHKPAWQGSTAEQLNEFLFRHVALERIEVDIEGERPAARSDLEKQLEQAIKEDRASRLFLWILTGAFAVIGIWAATDSQWKPLVCFVVYSAIYVPTALWLFIHRGEKVQKLRRDLEAYERDAKV